eukprot:12216058-Prorocentrum_lima.AAC.1
MLWNQWTTSRRFQGRLPCVLCRLPHEVDSVEHYMFCPKVRLLAESFENSRTKRAMLPLTR